MNIDKLLPIIEGILFLNGDDGVDIKDIFSVIDGINKKDILNGLKLLEEKYNDNNHGIKIVSFAKTKYRITTRIEQYPYYVKLRKINVSKKLSKSTMEVLAIIAYKFPITKSKIEKIRGVSSDHIIYKLKDLDFIKECGRSNEIGSPKQYTITENFMKKFNINSIDELPKINLNFNLNVNNDLYEK